MKTTKPYQDLFVIADTLKQKLNEEKDVHVVNEIRQLLCICFGYEDFPDEISKEDMDMLRERTEAVILGVKHKLRFDL